jgi:hypothetical protein
VITLALHAVAPMAGAQQVGGRLLDIATASPIRGGVLTLLAGDSSVMASAETDSGGFWRLRAPRPGTYHVSARRVGYRPWISRAVTLAVGADLQLVVRLQPVPVTLDPVTARAAATRQHLELNGFFERQKSNFGHFVTPDAIDRRQASRVTDLLTVIPGVQLFVSGGGSAGAAQVGLRGSSVTDGALCRPRVFVDGVMYARGDSRPVRVRPSTATEQEDLEIRMDRSFSLDDIGHPSTIAAVEVYRSATQVPVQFGGTSAETLCGVIVIWTRTGRTTTSTP